MSFITVGCCLTRDFRVASLEAAISFPAGGPVPIGRQFNQKAIFDLSDMQEIFTGGTGEALAGLPSIEERLARVR
jgi:hypothetical protein